METLTLKIDDLDIQGYGIAHYNDKTYFVKNALINEEVECRVNYIRNKIYYCSVLKYLKESELRKNPPCVYYNRCGGCNLQHLTYSSCLKYKQNLVKNTIKKIANIDVLVEETVESKNFNYRNKMAMPVRLIKNKPTLCMFEENSHKPIKIEKCLIQNEKFEILIDILNNFFAENKVTSYNEKTFKGDLKFVVARIINNNLLLTFVVKNKVNYNFKALYAEFLQYFDKVGISLNINTLKTNIILTDKLIHIIGEKYLSLNEFGFKFNIDNLSFLQVNTEIQNKIYSKILEFVNDDIVVNAYSGAGLLTAILSKTAKQVYGLEIVKDAHNNAENLIKENNILNVTNILGDANTKLEEISNEFPSYTLVVDPPRKGLEDKILNTILKTKPKKIIYVSCNPISLAKNINSLKEKYKITKVIPFDMFPQTCHVETLCVLELKENN